MSDQPSGPGWWQASDGKWYPPQPPGSAPPVVVVKKKGGCFRWIGIAVVAFIALIVIVAVAAGSKKDTKTSSADKPAASSSGTAVYSLGQTAHTGDFDVTLKQVQDPFTSANQLDKAPAGQRYVAVEMLVTNTADEQKTLSTLIGAELHDSQSRAWNIALAGVDLPQLDGTVAKGESRDGWVVFAVAQDATGLTLRIKGDLTSNGSVFALG